MLSRHYDHTFHNLLNSANKGRTRKMRLKTEQDQNRREFTQNEDL